MDTLPSLIRDLVVANRILAHEGVVDGYGHISVRHPERPDCMLLSRSRSPELVEASDIVTYDFEGNACDGDTRPPYLERFIHGGIYAQRPDVHAVVHSHAEGVLPYTISDVPLKVVLHQAAYTGMHVAKWDIADKFGDTDLLVTNNDHGHDLAHTLGDASVVLMRGHGFTAAASSLFKVLRIAVYLPVNARVLTDAHTLGGQIKAMTPGEITRHASIDTESPASRRAWEYWARRAGCEHML